MVGGTRVGFLRAVWLALSSSHLRAWEPSETRPPRSETRSEAQLRGMSTDYNSCTSSN